MPHDFFHRASWRAFRLGALVVAMPLAVVFVAVTALLWRLSCGPLEVTWVARHFTPIVIQAGEQSGHPAGRLTWDRVFLSWKPGLRHVHPLLMFDARGLRILRRDGTEAVTMRNAHMALRMAPLLHGSFEPTSLDLDNARVVLRRKSDGGVDLDWPGAVHRSSGSGSFSVAFLHEVKMQAVTIVLRDAVSGHQPETGDVGLRIEHADLARPSGADIAEWTGNLMGTVGPGLNPVMPFSAQGTKKSEGIVWHVLSGPVMPDLFAGLLPHARAWHVPVMLDTRFLLLPMAQQGKAAFPVADAVIGVAFGKGMIDQHDDQPLSVSEGGISAHLAFQGQKAVIDNVQARITLIDDLAHSTSFAASGYLTLDSLSQARQIDAEISASATTLDVSHMAAIWPRVVMKGARRWVTRNLTGGTGRGLAFNTRIQSDSGWAKLHPVQTTAALQVDDVTVHWLRPIPPMRHVSARFSFAGPDILKIDFLGGVQASSDARAAPELHLDNGTMLISDLLDHDQIGTITLSISGDLAAHLGLLAHPRLHLLSRHPLPFTNPSGPVTVTGQLNLPLSSHIENDQIHVTAEARFSNVALGHVVLGRDLTQATGIMNATERRLTLSGHGLLDNTPTTAQMEEKFISRDGGVRERVHAVSVIDRAALNRLHIAGQVVFQGAAQLVTDYTARFDGNADLLLNLDLANAALTLPAWQKAQGDKASASAHLALTRGQITALDRVRVDGQDLHVDGHGQIDQGVVRSMVLDQFRIGRSTGDAVIEVPSSDEAPVNVHIRAQDLDLVPFLHGDNTRSSGVAAASSSQGHAAQSAPEMSWNVDLATDRLFYSKTGSFGGVVAHVEHRNRRVEKVEFSAKWPVAIQAQLIPKQTGRYLQLDVDNLGLLLNRTDMTKRLEGGRAKVTGRVGNGGKGQLPPFEGVISVSPFTFLQPPAALTAATRLSVFHWSQASSDRFEVQHLRLPVKVANDVMTVHDGHLGNPALGATLEGKIDLSQGHLDLRGTVVPVFGLNAAPGRLPNIGKLFSPEAGGGVLAATFNVSGTAGNPSLSVNPFAMLLPGVMRQLAK